MSNRTGSSIEPGKISRMLLALALVGMLIGINANVASATAIGGIDFELDANAVEDTGEDWETIYDEGDNDGGTQTATTGIVDDKASIDQSFFKGGGSKDTRVISQWAYSATDVSPPKDQLTNAYAAAYRNTGDDLIFTFGSDRFANNGDAAIGFWFFKDNVTAADGKFTGAHKPGDLLITSDFTNGGRVGTIKVFQWQANETLLNVVNIENSTASADCASETHHALICATGNGSSSETAPWPYLSATGTTDFPVNSFLEGGINITDLVPSDDGCFASFMAMSRSSTSTTAQLKDFVLKRFPVCEPTTTMASTPSAANPAVIIAGDSATFTFKEHNDGDLPLSNVNVTTDNTSCGTLNTYTGDTNTNSKLDPGETFTFQCTLTNITVDTTITGIGHGTDFRGKDVTYCTTVADQSDPAKVCDPEERAQVAVNVVYPSTSMTSTAATASPTTIHSGETSTLTFYETNDGTGGTDAQLALSNVYVTTNDTDCGSTLSTPASGDTNGNSKLDVGETWAFTCDIAPTNANGLDGLHTVTATGHGTILGRDVTFCTTSSSTQLCDAQERTSASVTIVNPSTTLTMTASAQVTYTYVEANNAGDGSSLTPPTPTDRTSVINDPNCSNVGYVSGDVDDDKKLDDGESWTFTCTATVTGPTATGGVTNTATGHGIDATGDDVTWCTAAELLAPGAKFCDQDERDSVTVTITHN